MVGFGLFAYTVFCQLEDLFHSALPETSSRKVFEESRILSAHCVSFALEDITLGWILGSDANPTIGVVTYL